MKIPAAGLTTRRSTANRCSPWTTAPCVGTAMPTHSSSLSRSSGVETEIVRLPSIERLAMPVSTRPGPSSAKSVTPSSASSSRQYFHRTGLDSCAESSADHSSP